MNHIKTEISQARWCNEKGEFKSARFLEKKDQEIFWFDELFTGSIQIPLQDKEDGKPMYILLSGPPGSGKSTLALEMCYRYQDKSSFYISAESEAAKLREKALSYGWKYADSVFKTISKFDTNTNKDENACQNVFIWGVRDKLNRKKLKSFGKISANTKAIIKSCLSLASLLTPILGSSFGFINKLTRVAFNHWPVKSKKDANNKLGFLVIDSLNVVPQQKRHKLFDKLQKDIEYGPQAVIFIIDSGNALHEHKYWEHVCDVVVRMDYHCKEVSDYFVRTIEVIKARYQSHVWGKHQLKIYGKPKITEDFIETFVETTGKQFKEEIERKKKNLQKDSKNEIIQDLIRKHDNKLYEEFVQKQRRAHPYCDEGGIFIFPSIHWFLSNYKRRSPVNISGKFPSHLMQLNKLLGKNGETSGFPRGRCTALVGSRGTHKSHLGYYHILHSLYTSRKENRNNSDKMERALIISLRDDEGMAKEVMVSILEEIMRKDNNDINRQEASNELNEYIKDGCFEILYFPPGYITPEEFYHRVLMSVLRLKYHTHSESNVTVLFNSLDQLYARFPLCAREDVFIPGLIDTFTAEGISSFFITVDEKGQPAHQYGLLSMADLIISAKQSIFERDEYFGHIKEGWNLSNDISDEIKKLYGKDKIQAVVLWVDRYAGGQRAGQGGVLELVNNSTSRKLYEYIKNNIKENKNHPIYNDLNSGIIFTPFSVNYKSEE